MAYKQEPKSPVLKRCWEGYSPVPGKKKEEKGSCAKSPAKIAPLVAMAGKAIIGSLVSKAVDKASPAKIRKALSTKVTKAKQPGDEGYVKPKETSKFMRKAGTHASGGGQDRDIKIKSPTKKTAAWTRKEGKSKTGGLNQKGVDAYKRDNPGSKLKTAVTTKPSKLKKGSKAANRRKSFCARMGGMPGAMKKPNGEPTRKKLALDKWNC